MPTLCEYNQNDTKIRNISHEIRNHLSICDMYSQIIKKTLERNGNTNTSVENALECIQKSLKIIEMNVTDLRATSDNNVLKIYNLADIVEKGIELSKAYIDEKEINMNCSIISTPYIKTDENRLLSCIVNIIKNGIEAIPQKGTISISLYTEKNYAVIEISNNGEMIPYETQKHLFENGFTTKEYGSGYGLDICKKYINSQDGDIELLKSDENETTFKITLPVFE